MRNQSSSSQAFDYESLPVHVRPEARHAALTVIAAMTEIEIRVLEVGEHLTTMKQKLEHGSFRPWVEGACGILMRTGQNYMAAYEATERFPAIKETRTFQLTELYRLGRRTRTEESAVVVTEILRRDPMASPAIILGAIDGRVAALDAPVPTRVQRLPAKNERSALTEAEQSLIVDVALLLGPRIEPFLQLLRRADVNSICEAFATAK